MPPAVEDGAGLLGGVSAGGVEDVGTSFPAATDLRDFFLKRQARKKIGGALLGRESGVAILRAVGGSGFVLCQSGEGERESYGYKECGGSCAGGHCGAFLQVRW